MELKSGSRLADRYKVVGCLGTGAYGPVFLAEDEKRDNDLVALKVFHDGVLGSNKARSTLKESLTVIREQGSSELVKPLQYICGSDLHAVAMEYVRGEDLSTKLEKKELHINDLRPILKKISIELHRLHERGIVYNDLCPSHIIFADNGVIKLGGFPMQMGKQADLALPMSLRLGTAHYKSPEYLKTGRSDARSDVYSLGVLGLELLQGLEQRSSQSRSSLKQVHSRAASALPEDRFQSAFEFASALDLPDEQRGEPMPLGIRSLSIILIAYSAVITGIFYFLSKTL